MRSQISKSWIYGFFLIGSIAWAGMALTHDSSEVALVEVLPFSSAPMPAEQLNEPSGKKRHC